MYLFIIEHMRADINVYSRVSHPTEFILRCNLTPKKSLTPDSLIMTLQMEIALSRDLGEASPKFLDKYLKSNLAPAPRHPLPPRDTGPDPRGRGASRRPPRSGLFLATPPGREFNIHRSPPHDMSWGQGGFRSRTQAAHRLLCAVFGVRCAVLPKKSPGRNDESIRRDAVLCHMARAGPNTLPTPPPHVVGPPPVGPDLSPKNSHSTRLNLE